MSRILLPLFVLLCLGSLLSIGFSLFLWNATGMWLYDTNLEVFDRVLDDRQRSGIIQSARAHLAPVVLLLGVSNLLWASLTAVALFRRAKGAEDDISSAPDGSTRELRHPRTGGGCA